MGWTLFDHAPGPGKTPKDVPTHPVETPRRKLSFSGVKVEKSSEPKKLEKAKSTPQLDEPKASLKRLRGKTADTAVEKPEESGEPEIPEESIRKKKKER